MGSHFKTSPGNLSDPVIEPAFPSLAGGFFTIEPPGEPTVDDSAIKKDEIMPFAATWTDLEIIIRSEVSQTEKDNYHVMSLICGL